MATVPMSYDPYSKGPLNMQISVEIFSSIAIKIFYTEYIYQRCFILPFHDLIYTNSSITERGSCKDYPVLISRLK